MGDDQPSSICSMCDHKAQYRITAILNAHTSTIVCGNDLITVKAVLKALKMKEYFGIDNMEVKN